jgi:hypothetical protein
VANALRQVAPWTIRSWSLTTLGEMPMKIGVNVKAHSKNVSSSPRVAAALYVGTLAIVPLGATYSCGRRSNAPEAGHLGKIG